MIRTLLYITFCVLIFESNQLNAQQKDIYHIRNYRSDLSVEFQNRSSKFGVIDAYGKFQRYSFNNSGKYFFQGQEFDSQLGVYLFPSRLYDPKRNKFFQVDPKSQYHSPYAFVGADPINIVDRDGNQGKPLVLYAEEHDRPGATSDYLDALKSNFPDAHYAPLSDVVNGDVAPLPEWDGNVFISTHAGTDEGAELEVESGVDNADFKTEDLAEDVIEDSGRIRAGVSGEYLGERLEELAEERGVPLKNVFVGGCQGGVAAEKVSKGFLAQAKGKLQGIKARFIGPKRGNLLLYELASKNEDGTIKPNDTRVHFVPEDKNIHKNYRTNANGEEEFVGFRHTNRATGEVRDVQSAGPQDMQELVQGRVPSNLQSELSVFEGMY